VELLFPEIPPAWEELGELTAEVRYMDASGRLVLERLPWSAGRVGLLLPKERVSAVLVLPRIPTGRAAPSAAPLLRPAGAFYPFSMAGVAAAGGVLAGSGNVLTASWLHGAVVAELSPLTEEAGWEWFNIRRFLEELARAEEASPWWLEWQRIRERLWGHSFRSSYIDGAERVSLTVPLPAGRWVSVDPFLPVLLVPSPGTDPAVAAAWNGPGTEPVSSAAAAASSAAAADSSAAAAAAGRTAGQSGAHAEEWFETGIELPEGLHRYLDPGSRRRLDIHVEPLTGATVMVRGY
jgi:hypothetical protein